MPVPHAIALRFPLSRAEVRVLARAKLPSRHVSVGVESAPHRSYYYAMGWTEEDIAKPFVALASAGNDSAPCNTMLDAQADWAREGVMAAGGPSTSRPAPTSGSRSRSTSSRAGSERTTP